MTQATDPRVRQEDGVAYRDLNGNGRLDPYEDPRLPVADRVADLLGRMTLPEKAGLMFHTMMETAAEGLFEPPPERRDEPADVLSTHRLVVDRHISHFNVAPRMEPALFARWQNRLQDLAAATRLGIPVTLSTDPVHGFVDNPATSAATQTFSRWPEPLGFGAVGDPELVRQWGDAVRREYTALGIRVALHPQADLATEPRWSRVVGTFGSRPEAVAELVAAYVQGLQGETLGAGSVAAMVKHFPGAGPQLRGDDAHFPYGKEQVYPGGNHEAHLMPFAAAVRAGVAQVMPYYAVPVGLDVPEVGFGFNAAVVTGWLRERLGFQGVVCSDWGLVTDVRVGGVRWPARCWGMETEPRIERVRRIVEAGCDQLGGEFCPELVVELVETGRLAQERVDASARRVLADKFRLGLFDDPYVDPAAAARTVGAADLRAAGRRAQQRALVLLKNDVVDARPLLPLPAGTAVVADDVDAVALAEHGAAVTDAERAQVRVVRLDAPHEVRDTGVDYEAAFHQGRLDLPPDERDRYVALLAAQPSVLVVRLDRPAVIPELVAAATAVVAEFGATDDALVEVLMGGASPRGRLPLEMPSSMASVEASREDVPDDTGDPLFPVGFGLDYGEADRS